MSDLALAERAGATVVECACVIEFPEMKVSRGSPYCEVVGPRYFVSLYYGSYDRGEQLSGWKTYMADNFNCVGWNEHKTTRIQKYRCLKLHHVRIIALHL